MARFGRARAGRRAALAFRHDRGPTDQQQGYAAWPPSAAGYEPAPVPGNPTPRPVLRGWVITGLAIIGFGLGALVLGAYYGMTLGVLTSLFAIVLAAIPLTIVIPTFVWLDRYEAEPTKYLVAAFLWGALIAALLAGLLNTSAHVVFSTATDPEQAALATAVFSAPSSRRPPRDCSSSWCGGCGGGSSTASPTGWSMPASWRPASRSPRTSSTSASPTSRAGSRC